MRQLSSVQNPDIRRLRALRHAKGRMEQGCFLVEGVKLVTEALRYAQVVTVLADEAMRDTFAPLLEKAADGILSPAHVVEAVCETRQPQGICAAVRFPALLDLDAARGAVLALDGVQDPGNVGTMLRTAEASGFSAALLSPTCADAFAPKTVRATMGSIFRLPLLRASLTEALPLLKSRGFRLVTADSRGESFFDSAERFHAPLALIIGNEGNGISPEVNALADLRVALPMRGHAESLNAAVAAGILMYSIAEGISSEMP